MIVKMIKELRRRRDKQREKLEVLPKRKYKEQPEIKNTIAEMKTTLQEINSRLEDAEEQISNLEDREMEINLLEEQIIIVIQKMRIV